MTITHSDKAALRGEPSYVWRAGQERRLKMIREAAGERLFGVVFENGVGLGLISLVWQSMPDKQLVWMWNWNEPGKPKPA